MLYHVVLINSIRYTEDFVEGRPAADEEEEDDEDPDEEFDEMDAEPEEELSQEGIVEGKRKRPTTVVDDSIKKEKVKKESRGEKKPKRESRGSEDD